MNIKEALNRVVNQLDLSTEEMQDVMREIMTGQCTDAQIGAFLMGMRMKSETIDEIVGAVSVMRELASHVHLQTLDHVVDVVGTGGDGANIFNVSTAASFVVAAAGGKVAKHGNRAVSGKSGSADLLETAGIYLSLTPVQVARCIESVGVGFMFAQVHHSAMKYAAVPRRELGLRTLFNMLGPLTNPAGVKHQVVGVFQGLMRRLHLVGGQAGQEGERRPVEQAEPAEIPAGRGCGRPAGQRHGDQQDVEQHVRPARRDFFPAAHGLGHGEHVVENFGQAVRIRRAAHGGNTGRSRRRNRRLPGPARCEGEQPHAHRSRHRRRLHADAAR